MKRIPMTIEELRELNPSLDNPIELVCDNGYYTADLKEITVIGFYEDNLNIINSNGRATCFNPFNLGHYPSFKPQPTIERVWECLSNCGDIEYRFENGSYPDFGQKRKSSVVNKEPLTRKLGRWIDIDLDTFEIVGRSE